MEGHKPLQKRIDADWRFPPTFSGNMRDDVEHCVNWILLFAERRPMAASITAQADIARLVCRHIKREL